MSVLLATSHSGFEGLELKLKQNYKVIIIGSGFGGQLAAVNLVRQGISNFLILERREGQEATLRVAF